MVEIKKATAEDLLDFYGPDNPWKVEAWTAWYKGKRAAIAGISFNDFGNVVFSDYKRDVGAPRMTAYRTSLALMNEIRKTGIACKTVCFPGLNCHNEPDRKSAKFLELMGFRYAYWDENGFAVFELVGR